MINLFWIFFQIRILFDFRIRIFEHQKTSENGNNPDPFFVFTQQAEKPAGFCSMSGKVAYPVPLIPSALSPLPIQESKPRDAVLAETRQTSLTKMVSRMIES